MPTATTTSDRLLLPDPPFEAAIEEFLNATGRLAEIQAEGHTKCPNTNDKPLGCTYCLKHFDDQYAVWKLLMVINAPPV